MARNYLFRKPQRINIQNWKPIASQWAWTVRKGKSHFLANRKNAVPICYVIWHLSKYWYCAAKIDDLQFFFKVIAAHFFFCVCSIYFWLRLVEIGPSSNETQFAYIQQSGDWLLFLIAAQLRTSGRKSCLLCESIQFIVDAKWINNKKKKTKSPRKTNMVFSIRMILILFLL